MVGVFKAIHFVSLLQLLLSAGPIYFGPEHEQGGCPLVLSSTAKKQCNAEAHLKMSESQEFMMEFPTPQKRRRTVRKGDFFGMRPGVYEMLDWECLGKPAGVHLRS